MCTANDLPGELGAEDIPEEVLTGKAG